MKQIPKFTSNLLSWVLILGTAFLCGFGVTLIGSWHPKDVIIGMLLLVLATVGLIAAFQFAPVVFVRLKGGLYIVKHR